MKMWEEQNQGDDGNYEHYAEGYKDLTRVKDEWLDAKCDELFGMRPIPFVPKKGENFTLEREMERLIIQQNVTIPIVHVKGNVYLIGTQKQIVQFKGDQLMVRLGGGYSIFEEYIPQNHRIFERALLSNMIKSKESLQWVCEALK